MLVSCSGPQQLASEGEMVIVFVGGCNRTSGSMICSLCICTPKIHQAFATRFLGALSLTIYFGYSCFKSLWLLVNGFRSLINGCVAASSRLWIGLLMSLSSGVVEHAAYLPGLITPVVINSTPP